MQDIARLNQRVETFLAGMRGALAGLRNLYCYVFRDGTALILANPDNDTQKQALDVFYCQQCAYLAHKTLFL